MTFLAFPALAPFFFPVGISTNKMKSGRATADANFQKELLLAFINIENANKETWC